MSTTRRADMEGLNADMVVMRGGADQLVVMVMYGRRRAAIGEQAT